ncbi:hypothetical protein [Pandoraea sp. SD6-2]|uniref:hypothetical protein n=1 Tax=Pandoraea sp. SD6-2 TaxID=1286093 RepID=UPI00032DAF0E|nr:hypothetical protein [Pandoraea sp. SD6-2]EON12825.1 hypothetical protein C266_14417 [Pandoraea sp. SD6-2]
MSQEFVYQFDINGYVVIPAAISQPHLQRLQDYWSENLIGLQLHDVNFDWTICFVPMSASSAAATGR